MSAIQDNLKASNANYAANFTKGHLALPPAKKYLVRKLERTMSSSISQSLVTCMDARIDPSAAFGIELGDAHVIRNAGANAKDAQRSIIISEQLLGTKEIILIKHTGCGMLTFQNEDAHRIVEKNLGSTAAKEIAGLDFLPFSDLEQAVKDDVQFLKSTETIPPDVTISGWVYDVGTGKATQIV